jgi:peptidoglycan/LPS O-acetylase OafA/YrhL
LKRPEVQGLYGIWITPLSIFETLAAIIITISLVLLVSQILYHRIENPFRERSRKFIQILHP